MQAMTRRWAVVAVVAVAIPATATAAVASPEPLARAARSCGLGGQYSSLGPTYVESLQVSGTSCGTGVRLIKAYDRCRLNSGGLKGHCHSKVRGFRCTENRSGSSVQFVGITRCTSGGAVVKFKYSENT